MQACRERKWGKRSFGDHVGEFDGGGAGRVFAGAGGQEQGERLSSGAHVRPRSEAGVQDTDGSVRELSSEDPGDIEGPGRGVRTAGRQPVYQRVDAVAGRTGL